MNAVLPSTPRMGQLIPGSWLDLMARGAPLVDAAGNQLPRRFVHDPKLYTEKEGAEGFALFASLDFSNSAMKAAMPHATKPRLTTLREPLAFWRAERIRSGKRVETARVQLSPRTKEDKPEDSGEFWFGTTAVSLNRSEVLPVGSTFHRTSDRRVVWTAFATLAKLLREAGYAPGSYQLLLALGVPDDEVGANERTGAVELEPKTREAMKALRGQSYTVTLDGEVYTIQVHNFVPFAQSMGTYFVWSRNLAGDNLARDYEEVVVIDYGHGHEQMVYIYTTREGDRYLVRSSSEPLGRGVVALTEELVEMLASDPELAGINVNDALIREALHTGKTSYGGQPVNITDKIQQVKLTQGENLLARALPTYQNLSAYAINTGGGVPLFGETLMERLVAAGRTSRTALIVPESIAVFANAAGGIVAAYAAVPATRRV